MNIHDTLKERKVQHGPFHRHAKIELALRHILEVHGKHLTDVQKVSMGMIMHKQARILSGGNQHSDTWKDIAGYAILAEQEILDE